MDPKRFPQHALGAIPLYCLAYFPACHYSKGDFLIPLRVEKNNALADGFPPTPIDRTEITGRDPSSLGNGMTGSIHTGRTLGIQAVSLLRPFDLRALIIARPALVLIRLRKPCFRFRLMLLGWKVLFKANLLITK